MEPLARSTAPPYEGPLEARAAVDALQCDGKAPYARSAGQYDVGPERLQEGREAAFHDFLRQRGLGWETPMEGYRLERSEPRRALVSYDVDGRTKVAVVLADGLRGAEETEGWGVLAWGQCDPAELPAAVTDELDVGVWEDPAGRRMPVTEVRSFRGAEHCDWTETTFLLVGGDHDQADWYVRDATGEFRATLRDAFAAEAALPAEATDTGRRRGGRHLWLGPDAAYLVAADDPADVERWPRAREPIMCA